MAKYRHIVFDVDGTLIDTETAYYIHCRRCSCDGKSGERYEIEDLKFVLANTSVKNMHLLGVEEEKSLAQSKCGWQMKRRTSI